MIPDDVLHEIKTAPDDLPMGVKIPPYCRGVDDERHRNRIAAFGAIRRAAEIMRWHEANAKRLAPLRPDGLNEYEAKAIRRAIRAAIGSEKA